MTLTTSMAWVGDSGSRVAMASAANPDSGWLRAKSSCRASFMAYLRPPGVGSGSRCTTWERSRPAPICTPRRYSRRRRAGLVIAASMMCWTAVTVSSSRCSTLSTIASVTRMVACSVSGVESMSLSKVSSV